MSTTTTDLFSADRLNNSVNGNPRYRLNTSAGSFVTQSDSSCAYDVGNILRRIPSGGSFPVILTTTRAGRVSDIRDAIPADQRRALDVIAAQHSSRHDARFDLGDLEAAAQFAPFAVGAARDLRVRVVTTYASGETETRTGRVGYTSGWRPAFLLMGRAGAVGSSDVLGARDEIVAVRRGRTYVAGNRP